MKGIGPLKTWKEAEAAEVAVASALAKRGHGGGIEWTIKDGIPYHVPTLMKEVKGMVAKARAERPRRPS